MSDAHHEWSLDGSLPEIRPHSLAKHRVIDGYLRRYVEVLTRNPQIPEFRLTLVDGFAGGGLYTDSITKEERPGSPLLMLSAMHDAAEKAQQARDNPFKLDVEYFFIERKRKVVEVLKRTLAQSRYSHLVDDRVHVVNGQFVMHVDSIIERIEQRGRGNRAIFVLDQCGYKDVPLPALRKILSRLDNAEVILTFATDWLIDHLQREDGMQDTLEKIGLPIAPHEIQTAKERHDWRRAVQFLLHRDIHTGSGAEFYTPFFIRSKDAHRDFWLIHLSGHAKARDVMVGLHWKENASFAHYGRPGLHMLGYDQDQDFSLSGDKLLPGFFFDATAQASSHAALLEELPKLLSIQSGGISFRDLFASITNETPATSQIINGVLADLAHEGVIKIVDKTGMVKRRSGTQHNSDIIIPSEQQYFTFE